MREASGSVSGDQQPQRATRATWLAFLAMCLGMFMAILDIQIVVTSLPAIGEQLGISPDRISWVQTSYLIAEVIAIPLTGFLTRALTLRRLFLGALTLFVAASVACATTETFEALVAARVVQGLAGGCLIPLVFAAVFLMFPARSQGVATTIAGALAVLAPTLGPAIGGYITETYSWPWLFLVNVGPGLVSLGIGGWLMPRQKGEPVVLRRIDWASLLLLSAALAAFEIGLKAGPKDGWLSGQVGVLLAVCLLSAAAFVQRTRGHPVPLVRLELLRDRNFAIACGLSFVFGIGLFASVYLMPVFLGLVRAHGPLTIGMIMLVTGISQLIIAPIAVQAELRFDVRLLTALGFACFAIGLGLSAFQTVSTDFDEMFWPQVLRGIAIMFCLIPPTRLALGFLSARDVPDGSALFNVMRNLGGAIGIALVDTVIWENTRAHAEALVGRLREGDRAAAEFIGVPLALVQSDGALPSLEQLELLRPLIERASLVMAINDAWLVIAVLTASALVLIAFARPAAAR
jgi:DHA2 family multidrug resistance protein